eukprot:sb/3472538/
MVISAMVIRPTSYLVSRYFLPLAEPLIHELLYSVSHYIITLAIVPSMGWNLWFLFIDLLCQKLTEISWLEREFEKKKRKGERERDRERERERERKRECVREREREKSEMERCLMMSMFDETLSIYYHQLLKMRLISSVALATHELYGHLNHLFRVSGLYFVCYI